MAVSARNEGPLNEAAAAIESSTNATCHAFPLDVTDGDAIVSVHEQVARRLGSVDILVSNAGGPPAGHFASLDDDHLEAAFELIVASAWRLARTVTPGMQGRGGCLIFLTSTSVKEGIPTLLLSNMLRPAVIGMAKTLSQELGPEGIRVLAVAPGRIDTARSTELDEAAAAATGRAVEEIKGEGEARIPLGRYGRPREIGDVVAFLASERASYMTGVTVVVDGGSLHGIMS